MAACVKDAPNEPVLPRTIQPNPELAGNPFRIQPLQFPQAWLDDPALQLFGGLGSDVEVTDAGATLGRVLFTMRPCPSMAQ